ncbi:MAG: glycosyltransferase, partial [Candidatus Bathyarchaeia archaeon]
IEFQVKEDGSVDLKRSLANPGPFLLNYIITKQVCAEIKIIKGYRPDVVVSDTRASSIIASRLLGIPVICILNQFNIIIPRKKRFLRLSKLADHGSIAILAKIWASSDKVLIPDFPEPYTLSEGNLNIPSVYRKKIRFTGPILPFYPDELPSKECLREEMGIGIEKKLVFAPISGPKKERYHLIKMLTKAFKDFSDEYRIVMSMGEPEHSNMLLSDGKISIYGWIEDRFKYLKACDVIVARAGHETLVHSISYGKPIILVPTPNHTEQLVNAKKAFDLGFALVLDQSKIDAKTLLNSVERAMNSCVNSKVREMSSMARRFNGVKAILEEIMRYAN